MPPETQFLEILSLLRKHDIEFIVIGEDRAAIAVTPKRLRGEKASGRGVAHSAGATVVQQAAETLRGVAKKPEVFTSRNGLELAVICGLAKQVYRDHRAPA